MVSQGLAASGLPGPGELTFRLSEQSSKGSEAWEEDGRVREVDVLSP